MVRTRHFFSVPVPSTGVWTRILMWHRSIWGGIPSLTPLSGIRRRRQESNMGPHYSHPCYTQKITQEVYAAGISVGCWFSRLGVTRQNCDPVPSPPNSGTTSEPGRKLALDNLEIDTATGALSYSSANGHSLVTGSLIDVRLNSLELNQCKQSSDQVGQHF
mgnify:CR=1 FL=1